MQTQQNPNAFIIRTAIYGNTCLWCHDSITVGTEIAYRYSDRKIYHAACLRNKVAGDTQPQAHVAPVTTPMTQQQAISNLKVDAPHSNSTPDRTSAEAFHAMLREYSNDIPATGRKVQEQVQEEVQPTVTATATGIADGYYTVVLDDSTHRTFRIRTQSADDTFAPGKQIIATLTGSDNTSEYTRWGFVNGTQVAVWGKMQNRIGNWLELATGLITGNHKAAGLAYATKSGNCYRCNRLLTDPESIARGLGTTCAGKV